MDPNAYWIEYEGQKHDPVIWNYESEARKHGREAIKHGARNVRLYNNLTREVVYLSQGSTGEP